MRRAATTLAALAALAAAATPARADQRISAEFRDRYANPNVTIDPGERLTFFNGDVDDHSVTATSRGGDGRPLFDTGLIGTGREVEVTGATRLAPGAYGYYCTLHPFMTGSVTVRGTPTTGGGAGGTADRRAPRVSAAIATGDLARVRRTRALPVRVASDEAATVRLAATVRVGRRTVPIAAAGVALRVPGRRTTALRLTRAGRAAMLGRSSARVTVAVRATDAAGNVARASAVRTLRLPR